MCKEIKYFTHALWRKYTVSTPELKVLLFSKPRWRWVTLFHCNVSVKWDLHKIKRAQISSRFVFRDQDECENVLVPLYKLLAYRDEESPIHPWFLIGPDAATWLEDSSHSTRAGTWNQNGEHRPLFAEPHLATSFNWPDGAPTGEKLITIAEWMDSEPQHLLPGCHVFINNSFVLFVILDT